MWNKLVEFFSLSANVIITINLVLAIGLSWWLLDQLNQVDKNRTFGSDGSQSESILQLDPAKQQELPIDTLLQDSLQKTGGNTAQMDTSVTNQIAKERTQEDKKELGFYDILLLMLLAGALGGVLCNLRGIFEAYREQSTFPENLLVPYLIRPFTAGICGLFIYFVASLLVTSITLQPIARGVSFQGMISYISLAMIAGFGAQEFMERLKAVATTLFGEKQKDTRVATLQMYHQWVKEEKITPEEYATLKNRLFASEPIETQLERFEGMTNRD